MMHAMRDDVRDGAAIRLLGRRAVQRVDPPLIPRAALGHGSGHGCQVESSRVQTREQFGNGLDPGLSRILSTDRLPGREIRPHLDVPDNVPERGSNGPVSDVELVIELLIGQVQTAPGQLARRPGVVYLVTARWHT
jgi:hypothetical protein